MLKVKVSVTTKTMPKLKHKDRCKDQEDRLLVQLSRAERKRQERIRNRIAAENELLSGRDIRVYALN